MLKEITIQLETPLKLNELEVKEITLKEPTAGQMIKVQGYVGFEQNTRLIALMGGIQPLMAEQLSMSDYKKCANFLEECLRYENPDQS